MSGRPSNKAAGERRRGRAERSGRAAPPRQDAMAVAHVGFTRVGATGLLIVVLRYSRALWGQWVDFNATTAVFGHALIDAATSFGGAPRHFVFEEPDCRVLHWDGHREHFAGLLQTIAQHMSCELALWHERWCGPATRAGERLIWETTCPAGADLGAGNAALRVALEESMHLPHPCEPERSIAEALVVERAHLLPLPVSWAALDVWFEAEKDDDV